MKKLKASAPPSRPRRAAGPFFASRPSRAPFFRRGPVLARLAGRDVIQRQDGPKKAKEEDKDPLVEGAKLTVEKALEKPEVKEGLENLWEGLPDKAKISLMSFGGVSVGMLYAGILLSPEVREKFSGVDIGKPLSLIPYVPIESFKYRLSTPDKPGTGFSADFSFEDYFSLIRKSHPSFPISNLKFGLEGTLAPSGSFGLTGGKAGLEFFGGGLKAEGKTFTELSPYPTFFPGTGLEPSTTLMQSFPGQPPIHTGFGGQFMLSADLAKLFPKVFGGIPALGSP